MTEMPQHTGMPRRHGVLGRRALLRNGLVVGVGVAVLGAGSVATSGAAWANAAQNNWRWCVHRDGLYWAGNADSGQTATPLGICPYQSTGKPHTPGNTNYIVDSGDAVAEGIQNGWRWCVHCYVMFWGNGLAVNGVCPTGVGHVAGGSVYDMFPNMEPLGYENG